MYKTNLSLRTALKILKPIYFLRQNNEQALYNISVNWSRYINANQTLWLTPPFTDNFNHSEFVSQKKRMHIVINLEKEQDKRPSIDKVHPDLRINIHIDERPNLLH
jgi:putative N6-adenine-specific DNA methylase